MLDGFQRKCPVHRAGLEVQEAEASRKMRRERAFACACGTVDRNDRALATLWCLRWRSLLVLGHSGFCLRLPKGFLPLINLLKELGLPTDLPVGLPNGLCEGRS